MAKIKFGMMMVDARGKLNGQVFSKNKAGAYVRTKVTPTNPSTTAQSSARALFGSISQGWSGLTQSQRDAWDSAVPDWALTDIFGDLKNPTGKALYQRLNNQAQSAGLAAVTDVPAKVALPNDIVTAATIAIGAGTIATTGQNITVGVQVMTFATPVLSAGTKFVKNRLRDIYNDDADSWDQSSAYTAYVARFGAPTAGANVYIGTKYVMPNGQASPLQIIKATVTA